MNIRVICLLIIMALVIQETSAQTINFKKLDSLITIGMVDWQIPGLAIAIIKDGSTVYSKGFGLIDASSNAVVSPNTIFPIASITKSVTATAVGKALTDKELSWDEKIQKIIPRFQLDDPYLSSEITIRDLLSHRTGLPGNDLIWYGNSIATDVLIKKINDLKPTTAFRSSFQYNNLMYVLGGDIIHVLTGHSYKDYLAKEFFEPLDMNSTTIGLPEIPVVWAKPHALIHKKLKVVDSIDLNSVAPAGGIYSNVEDMAKWLNYLLRDQEDSKLSIAIDETQTPQNILPKDPFLDFMFPDSEFISYGMGWFVHSYRGDKVIEHTGNTDGYSTHIALLPEENLGLVILTNLNTNFFSFAINYSLIDMVLGNDEIDWHSHYFNGFNQFLQQLESIKKVKEKSRVENTKPSHSISNYMGTYVNEFYGNIIVKASDNELLIQFLNGFKGKSIHWHYNTFQIEWENELQGKSYVDFKLNDTGTITELTIDQLGLFPLGESFRKIK